MIRNILVSKFRIKGAVLAADVSHTILCQTVDLRIYVWENNQIENGVLTFSTYTDRN